jgi:hypothetical protein
VINRASLDDSGFKLVDCETQLNKLTQSLNPKTKKSEVPQSALLTKRKSSILNDNPIKKKLTGQTSPSNSKKGFELGDSKKKDSGFFGLFKSKESRESTAHVESSPCFSSPQT